MRTTSKFTFLCTLLCCFPAFAQVDLPSLAGRLGQLKIMLDNGVVEFQGHCQVHFDGAGRVEVTTDQLAQTLDRPLSNPDLDIIGAQSKWGVFDSTLRILGPSEREKNSWLFKETFKKDWQIAGPKGRTVSIHNSLTLAEIKDERKILVAIGRIEVSYALREQQRVGVKIDWDSLTFCEFQN